MSTESGDRLTPTPTEIELSTAEAATDAQRELIQSRMQLVAASIGYAFHTLTDGTFVFEPPADPDCCYTCAKQPAAVVALMDPDELDEDGQLWFGDYDIRVDTTGSGPAEIYLHGDLWNVDAIQNHAAALLAAVAAARSAR